MCGHFREDESALLYKRRGMAPLGNKQRRERRARVRAAASVDVHVKRRGDAKGGLGTPSRWRTSEFNKVLCADDGVSGGRERVAREAHGERPLAVVLWRDAADFDRVQRSADTPDRAVVCARRCDCGLLANVDTKRSWDFLAAVTQRHGHKDALIGAVRSPLRRQFHKRRAEPRRRLGLVASRDARNEV